MKWIPLFLAAALGCFLSLSAQPATSNGAPVASANYTLKPQDIISFRVIGEDETFTEAQISQDGSISFPYLAQPVKISGLTLQEARQKLFDLYVRDIYVNPQIQLNIMEYAPAYITVLGMVGRSGQVALPPEEDLSLLAAIARAGGWTQLSKRKEVELTRTLPDGKKEKFVIDARSIGPEEWILQEGDLINVPEIGF